ncbi:MAG: agglutinin biogenesis protein MshI, partial [Pseudomonadota bacterium]
MLSWFKRRSSAPGWLAASVDADRFDYAHGRYSPTGKSAITAYGTRRFDGAKNAMEKLARDLRLDGYQCATLLRPGEYQLLLVEAPTVPPAELKSAMRWRVKDMIDYHVDDATLDVLDIP